MRYEIPAVIVVEADTDRDALDRADRLMNHQAKTDGPIPVATETPKRSEERDDETPSEHAFSLGAVRAL